MYNDTTDDYEGFERRQIARDMDRRRSATLDIDSSTADDLITDLRHRNIVSVVPDEQLLVHEPSGTPFTDRAGMAYFHSGWDAARAEDE